MVNEPDAEPTQEVLESQFLRDLKWAIQSPSLIEDTRGENELPGVDKLSSIDDRELATYLAPYTKFRVGQYFEGLVLYWLEKVCQLKIVAQQKQIRKDRQTIGEIDFLFEDDEGRLNHCETAVKFYLHYPEENPTGSHFVGPNVSDWFEKKIQRLLEHQLPFGKKHFPEIALSKAFVKGMVFYHPDVTPPTQLPENMSASHLGGTWIRHSELSWLNATKENRLFRILHKPYWLSLEVSRSDNQDLISFEQLTSDLEQHFRNKEWPILISVLTCQQTLCKECNRIFVVPESWPQFDK